MNNYWKRDRHPTRDMDEFISKNFEALESERLNQKAHIQETQTDEWTNSYVSELMVDIYLDFINNEEKSLKTLKEWTGISKQWYNI